MRVGTGAPCATTSSSSSCGGGFDGKFPATIASRCECCEVVRERIRRSERSFRFAWHRFRTLVGSARAAWALDRPLGGPRARRGDLHRLCARICALIPRRWPDSRGSTCAGSLSPRSSSSSRRCAAVEVFAAEPKEEAAGRQENDPGRRSRRRSRRPRLQQGEATAGKASSRRRAARACHTFKAASSTGTVGPESRRPRSRARTRRSCTSRSSTPTRYRVRLPAQHHAPDFGQTLTAEQVDDLVAFLQSG